MSSLDGYFSTLVGFFSYSRDDDTGSRGALSALRDAIQWELSAQLGRAPKNFRIWQDKAAIPVGTDWEEQIKLGISQSAFFVPIITPRVFRSENCAFEFKAFLAREKQLGRADLVFPILYIPVPELEDEKLWRQDPVLSIVGTRQYFDWRDLRHRSLDSTDVAQNVEEFCQNIAKALRAPWETPQERAQREAAEAQRVAEQERQRGAVKIEAERRAEEEQRRGEADVARRAAEETLARQAQAEAQERAAAAAKKRAEADAAFAAARSANSVAAFDAFLAGYSDDVHAAEARELKSALLTREEAYRSAMASDDAAVLRSFCKTYKSGADADEVRARLRVLAPPPNWHLSRPALALAATLVAVLFVGVLVWVENRPSPVNQQASLPPAAPAKNPGTLAQLSPTPSAPANIPAAPFVPPSPPPLATVTPAPPAAPITPATQLPKTADAMPPGAGVAVTLPPPLNLDKWAFCRPGALQSYVGGALQRVTLKPILTAAKELRAIAISPDGTALVTAGDDSIIRVWDAASLKWIRDIHGHTAEVYAVVFSVDGNLLASASFDGTVRIWNAHTFALMQTFAATDDKGPVKLYDVAFEPLSNPQYVDSAAGDGTVWIWDLRSGQRASNPRSYSGGNDPRVGSLSFAPNGSGSFVTANFDGTVKFFEPGRADAITAFPDKALRVAYSPDGKLVASVGVDDTANKTVKLWNVADRTLFKAYDGQRHSAVSVAWSRDGKRFLSGGGYKDLTVRLWDVQSGKQLQVFAGHSADVEAVAIHPNQKWLISASEDATMKIWDIASGKELLSVVGFADGQYLAYAPNGCYTGSAKAANYVKYVTKDAQGREHDTGDNGSATLFVPGDSTALLLPQ